MTRLPVWATVKEAYKAIWVHRRSLLRLATVPFVLNVAVTYVLFGVWASVVWPNGLVAVSTMGFLVVLGQLAMLPLLAECYRLLLLGPEQAQAVPLYRFGPECRRLLVLLSILHVAWTIPFYVLIVQGGSNGMGELYLYASLGLCCYAILIYAEIRFAFLFPVISLNGPWDLPSRWCETRGNAARLFAALVVAFLPSFLGFLALEWAQTMQHSPIELRRLPPPPDEWLQWRAIHLPDLQSLTIFAVYGLLYGVWFVFPAAVTAVAYATLAGYPAKGVQVPSAPS